MFIENWKMNYKEHYGLECKAPCSMYSVLLQHGLIEDPFYGINELEYTKLSDYDCIFESEFYIDENKIHQNYIELVFLGLDSTFSMSKSMFVSVKIPYGLIFHHQQSILRR